MNTDPIYAKLYEDALAQAGKSPRYVLLSVGDLIRAGDEYFDYYNWVAFDAGHSRVGCPVTEVSLPTRRLLRDVGHAPEVLLRDPRRALTVDPETNNLSAVIPFPPWDEHAYHVLRRNQHELSRMAQRIREVLGEEIPQTPSAERARALYYALRMLAIHGPNWHWAANEELYPGTVETLTEETER